MTRLTLPQLLGSVAFLGACATTPPRDFTPDPGLIAQIRQIRIIPDRPSACPGAVIHVDYEAVLADSTRLPFAASYDAKHPPRLHVQFLERTSLEAVARKDGDWDADRNPLASLTTGFRLTASLRADPTITTTVMLPPAYDCMPRQLAFSGSSGIGSFAGDNGPDVTVRLDVRQSPFYQKLYVAGIQVAGARPFYVASDSATIGRGWLTVESRGGDGGNGQSGSDGIDGIPGAAGCPGSAGGQGQNGSDGGAGGDGGNGGRITIVVPPDRPDLASLVRGDSWGGSGGSGGAGGRAGRGGRGGQGLFDANNQPCSDGSDGASGFDGSAGRSGSAGSPGGRTVVATAATKDPS